MIVEVAEKTRLEFRAPEILLGFLESSHKMDMVGIVVINVISFML